LAACCSEILIYMTPVDGSVSEKEGAMVRAVWG
jgi:hypothetical protein